MSKKININSNAYIIIYAAVIVIIVAFLLAFVSKALQPKSDANVAIDTKSQILAALNIRNIDKSEIEKTYEQTVMADEIVDAQGNIVKDGSGKDQDGFKVNSKEISPECLPLFICKVDGQTKYVVPLYGTGLWGAIWGFVAVDADGQTIYGAYFSHQSETAGLGALISELPFQQQFAGKKIYGASGEVALSVVKVGKKVEGLDASNRCDALTGATLTSNGVDAMLKDGLKNYSRVFEGLRNEADTQDAALLQPSHTRGNS